MTRERPDIPSALCQAALQYARRGWPVFPCRECDETVDRGGEKKTFKAKAPYTPKGLKDATRDPHQIRLWWTRWPNALIGLPQGENGCFVLDFDPRVEELVDEATGEVTTEVYTLERLKSELEEQIGCEIPVSLAVVTPSGGVHVYLKQPDDDGAAIRNRGNLPKHVDVRGSGGYVIGPPSVIVEPASAASTGRYRFLRGRWDAELAAPPAELVEVLRAPKAAKKPAQAPGDRPQASARPATDRGDGVDEAVRKYALAALDGECRAVRTAGSGRRNPQLNESAFKVASLVAAGAIDAGVARSSLEAAARDNPGRDDDRQLIATLESGWSAGLNNPRDLSEVASALRERSSRPGRTQSSRAPSPAPSPSPPAPSSTSYGEPSSRKGGAAPEEPEKGAGDEQGRELAQKCAFYPQTDLGNLERFLARHGEDFLFVEQWGWLAWDGKRWNRELAVPLLGRAVQMTMRAIQDEAKLVRDSGVPDPEEEQEPRRDETEKERERRLHRLWSQRRLALLVDHDDERLDYIVQVKSNGEIVLFSDKLTAWGRTSEGAGHIGCIAKMAEARLSARTDDFDADPLLLNVENGTLVFLRPDEGYAAEARLREHRREDRMTKLAAAAYDPKAVCTKFDAFLAEVQPLPEMRDFLDTWAGYNSLGVADAQKMALFYGEGSNGKGVWINTHAHILGDYAWAAGIETFIDQGKYRKGSDASPDLAAMAGRRMVYANEPEDNSKFSDGLIKAMTSDEPIGGVRELMKPPFQLLVTFTNTVSANNMPKIGTDHGIQRRVQVVPWTVIIPDERADPLLKTKLKAEASGILNRMVRGALRYLSEGLAIPQAVKDATREYQHENDLLGRFLELCVERVDGETVGATALHRVFAAWQTWAGQLAASGKPWSAKYLNAQMKRKSFKIAKSSTMQWQDVALRYEAHDFVDSDNRAREEELPAPRTIAAKPASSSPSPTSPHPSREPDDDARPFG